MLDEFGMLLRQGKAQIPSKDLVREMVTFVVWEDGKPAAEEGTHDDRVIATGIAIQMGRNHRHTHTGDWDMWERRDTTTGL